MSRGVIIWQNNVLVQESGAEEEAKVSVEARAKAQ